MILFAKEAVVRQLSDGRLAVVGNLTAVTDPAAVGEALLFAPNGPNDPQMREAADRMLYWLLHTAPRTKDGILYHLHDRPQVWVDSFYMAPPFLSVAGRHEEAVKQIAGFRTLLLDPKKKLLSHIWDDGLHAFAQEGFLGSRQRVGPPGMTRVVRTLPDSMAKEKEMLIGWVREGVDACLACMRSDGLFHDVVDDPSTFVETNLSQMLSYVLYRGMAGGWIDSRLREARGNDEARRAGQGGWLRPGPGGVRFPALRPPGHCAGRPGVLPAHGSRGKRLLRSVTWTEVPRTRLTRVDMSFGSRCSWAGRRFSAFRCDPSSRRSGEAAHFFPSQRTAAKWWSAREEKRKGCRRIRQGRCRSARSGRFFQSPRGRQEPSRRPRRTLP